ncbi:hypothetical protein ACF3M1_01460 [Luteimonas sp. WGS1318]|uniref:hypothetical protein n=1 Tax=Luteimonas sp. WGS1318 TaxID=3366815 RepID=UPI00372D00A2
MSKPGMPYDNAMADSLFATLKLELMDDKPFENRGRMHLALDYRSPMQAEREYQSVRPVS